MKHPVGRYSLAMVTLDTLGIFPVGKKSLVYHLITCIKNIQIKFVVILWLIIINYYTYIFLNGQLQHPDTISVNQSKMILNVFSFYNEHGTIRNLCFTFLYLTKEFELVYTSKIIPLHR